MTQPPTGTVMGALTWLWRSTRSLGPVNRGLRATLGAPPWRGHVPRAIWRRIPAVGPFHVDVPGTPGFTYVGRGEPTLGKALFWRGIDSFEPGTAAVFAAVAGGARHFADIGAYSGYYSLLALTLNPILHAHCFEPVPALRDWLTEHLEANHFLSRASVVDAAISDTPASKAAFYVSQQANPAGSSLVGTIEAGRSVVTVNTTTLDEYKKSAGIPRFDLLKIDTESAEDRVLAGASGVLESDRPFVICEILDLDPNHLRKIEGLLAARRYAFGLITGAGVTRASALRPDPARVLRNFLLWPEERPLPEAVTTGQAGKPAR